MTATALTVLRSKVDLPWFEALFADDGALLAVKSVAPPGKGPVLGICFQARSLDAARIVSRDIRDPKEIAEVRSQCAPPLVALRIPDWAMDMDIDPELLRKIAHGEPEDDESISVGK
jgi:hypothetical protein